LLDAGLRVYLIDFDRARFKPGKPLQGQRNLDRLKRSLVKLWPTTTLSEMEPSWIQLKAGYHD
jgi:predicted Ser/Thr protein kinase